MYFSGKTFSTVNTLERLGFFLSTVFFMEMESHFILKGVFTDGTANFFYVLGEPC